MLCARLVAYTVLYCTWSGMWRTPLSAGLCRLLAVDELAVVPAVIPKRVYHLLPTQPYLTMHGYHCLALFDV